MSLIQGMSYEQLEIGQTAVFEKTLTERHMQLFAAVSGDLNPVHLDADFAATTFFQEPIGHGAWVGSVVSAAIAMRMPGPGSIYRSQQIAFKEPVRAGDTIAVTLEVTQKKDRIKLVVLACKVTNQHGSLVAKGVAEVIAPDEPVSVEQPELPGLDKF